MYICIYVCLYVCMYVCMYCTYYVCRYVCMYVCMHVRMDVLCIYMCVCACIHMCIYVNMYVCMYVCMYVRHVLKPTTYYTQCQSVRCKVPLALYNFIISPTFIRPSVQNTRQELKSNEMLGKNKYGYSQKRNLLN